MRPVGNALETQRLRVNSKKFTFGSPGTRGGRFLQRIRGSAKRLGKLGHFWVTATKIFMAPNPPDSLKHEARRGLALLKSVRTLHSGRVQRSFVHSPPQNGSGRFAQNPQICREKNKSFRPKSSKFAHKNENLFRKDDRQPNLLKTDAAAPVFVGNRAFRSYLDRPQTVGPQML